MGRMALRHSWQTGRREILIRGASQMRQPPGNKTAKRLSANWLAREATEAPATADLAWAARIGSPLLLKTASLTPASSPGRRAGDSCVE